MLRGVAERSLDDDGARHAGLDARARPADGLSWTLSSRGRSGDGARDGRRRHDLLREHRLELQSRSDRRGVGTGRDGSSCTSIATEAITRESRRARGRRGLLARCVSRSTRRSPARASATGATRCACRRICELGNFPASHTDDASSGLRPRVVARAVHRRAVGSGAHVGGRRVAAVDLADAGRS